MVRSSPRSTITLPDLIGHSVASSRCVLSAEQLGRLAQTLLRLRPQATQANCFLGGSLGTLAPNGAADQQIVTLQDALGDDPFLIIASKQGALALLTTPDDRGRNGSGGPAASYRAHIITDPETVDRAVLVLSQFGDYPYSFDGSGDQDAQRAFVASVVAGLLADPSLPGLELEPLLPQDQRWVALARALAAVGSSADSLGLPLVRQLLQECGVVQSLLGQLDADQQLMLPLASEGAPPPRRLAVRGWGIGGVTRTLTLNPKALPPGEGSEWLSGGALTAAPLVAERRVWGALLSSSERPLAAVHRANLSGLAAILAVRFSAANAPAQTPTPPLRQAPAPATRGTQLAARASSAARTPAPPSRSQSTASIGTGVLALLDNAGDGVLLLDSQGRLTTVTPSALRTLGLPPSVIGQVLADSPASFLVPLLAEALLDDEVGTQEITLPNGQLLNVVVKPIDQGGWAFQLLRPAAPVPTQALALIPVPQPIPSPTAVPEGERIERFLTTFSNGIRTPLRALRDLIAQVPVAGALNDQQGRLIGQVVKLNSEIMMLINDLFALGQMRLQSPESRMPLRLDLLVEAAAGTLYAEFGRRGQQAVLEIPTDLPQITGSEEGLWRAVSAILDNAIKYSPTGATITVSVVQQAHEAVVSVKDTGAGLAPDELEQVFDPFYRAHSSQHLDIPGRGLGLAIAKAVVEQHGGRIWATSVIGEGSTFSFSLPC